MMKKYAKNLGKMMLPPGTANAGPPFYLPSRFFGWSESWGVSY